MTTADSFSDSILSMIGEQAAKELSQLRRIETQLAEARKRHQFLSDLSTYIKKDWPQHVLALLSKESQTMKTIDAENQPLNDTLVSIRNAAMEKVAVLQRRFPAFLDEACKAANLPLDRESRDLLAAPRKSQKGRRCPAEF